MRLTHPIKSTVKDCRPLLDPTSLRSFLCVGADTELGG